jgi:AbrB family looped-hinge helix DNA binding protein
MKNAVLRYFRISDILHYIEHRGGSTMRQTLIVSNRGQLTLPANLRKRFGIKNGGPIILEERDNELALKPAMVLEVEMYTDAQIAAWDREDQLDDSERRRLSQRLRGRKTKK